MGDDHWEKQSNKYAHLKIGILKQLDIQEINPESDQAKNNGHQHAIIYFSSGQIFIYDLISLSLFRKNKPFSASLRENSS